MCLFQECSTWLNIATAQEESGCAFQDIESSYTAALRCAEKSGQARLQVRLSEQLKVSYETGENLKTILTELTEYMKKRFRITFYI